VLMLDFNIKANQNNYQLNFCQPCGELWTLGPAIFITSLKQGIPKPIVHRILMLNLN